MPRRPHAPAPKGTRLPAGKGGAARRAGRGGPGAPASVAGAARAIERMAIRGAQAIGLAAAQSLAHHLQATRGDAAQVRAAALAAARRLDAARPTAVTLHNSLGWMLEAVRRQRAPEAMRAAAARTANELAAAAAASRAAIAHHGAGHLRDGATVLTHCNSSTAVAILAQAHRDGKRIQVIATETRPFRQGLRTLGDLAKAGLHPDFIVDAAAEHMLSTRDIDLVLVGADTVARDGCLFNKIGTAGVARLAAAHGVPLLAAAGTAKFTRRTASDIPIEERSPDEVLSRTQRPRGVRVLNPVFDRTAPAFVRAYVTESGLRTPREAVLQNLKLLPREQVWT